ncbi:hypothetical protein QZH41_000811 [Actinostola sp. cb2023]|nr:hypothetical protein QZH41_000811 [Actinostola sp. cb2023]
MHGNTIMAMPPSSWQHHCHGNAIVMAMPPSSWQHHRHGNAIVMAMPSSWQHHCHGSTIVMAAPSSWQHHCHGSTIVLATPSSWQHIVMAAPSSWQHHHHGNTIIMATPSSWQHHHHGNTVIMATPSSWQHHHHHGNTIIMATFTTIIMNMFTISSVSCLEIYIVAQVNKLETEGKYAIESPTSPIHMIPPDTYDMEENEERSMIEPGSLEDPRVLQLKTKKGGLLIPQRVIEEITGPDDDMMDGKPERDAFDALFDNAPEKLGVVKKFHDGVFFIFLLGLLEGFFVPLYQFNVTPVNEDQKRQNVELALDLMKDSGLKFYAKTEVFVSFQTS